LETPNVRADSKRIKILCNKSSPQELQLGARVGSRGDLTFRPYVGQFKVARCDNADSKEDVMKALLDLYMRFSSLVSKLQSPFLLVVRLYWGWQFAQSGWGKLHNLDKVTGFFASLNLPEPGLTAHFVSGLEFVGGILLILGLGSRLIGLVLTVNMFVAYWTADKEALYSVFSDPGKFYVADPYTFLFASAMVLVFGAGLFSLDALLLRRWNAWIEK
jgi:putative oxidoreductase